MSAAILWALAIVLMVVGAAGIVLPAVPGVPLLFLGMLAGAAADGFARIGWITLSVLGLLTLATFAVEFAASALGAKRAGASKLAIWGAIIGTLAGVFFGIPGIVLGPFIGAVAGEVLVHGRLKQAGRVGIATWLGLLLGTIGKIAIACTMTGLFALAYFFD
jgi:uncharacterized protein YqgC (DUF456 family)